MIIKGKKLMLFVKDGEKYTSIALATSHTLNTSLSTVETSTKDDADASGNGRWADSDPDQFTWSVSTENLMAFEDAEGATIEKLWQIYTSGEKVEIRLGVAAKSTTGVPTSGWTQVTSGYDASYWHGDAIITSLTVNAPNGDNASFSAEFTGKGALELSVA